MKWDKILVLCLCICLICSMAIPTIVFAAEENNEVGSENSDTDGETEETEEEKNKRWYDYLIDGLALALKGITDPFNTVIDSVKTLAANLELFKPFNDLMDTLTSWESAQEELTDFFDFTNHETNQFLIRIWQLPIVKTLSYIMVFMLVLTIVFTLLKSF